MAFPANADVRISLIADYLGSTCINVWDYKAPLTPASVNAAQLGEAWWNHVKAVYRASVGASAGAVFNRVQVRDLGDPLGEYGEYAIPVGERAGTRSSASTEAVPTFVACGVRLAVATRVTRPGYKAIFGALETDISVNSFVSAYVTIVQALMNVMTVPMLLGAPAATATLDPQVVRLNRVTQAIVARQYIAGYSINLNVTHRVSRKLGRGI